MSTSLEETLQRYISGLTAVSALSPTIRPYRFNEQDLVPGSGFVGILIEVTDPDEQHPDLSMRGGAVSAKAAITSVAEVFESAWELAEAIRTNNTNPGTGLVGFHGTVTGSNITIQAITADGRTRGVVLREDGSDSGFYFVRQPYTIDHTEST